MARARNIKPGFFRNADLAELPVETRMLFIGLWTLADREGRMEDRPRQIKMEIYPADQFDVDLMLGQLQDGGFIVRYEVGGRRFIEVTNFIKHQDPHYKEKASELPPPPGKENFHKATGVTRTQRQRIMERDGFACRHCGSEDALCIDHILPVSRGGDSSDENLQVLCAACNTRKGNKIGGEEKNSRQRRVDVEASATQANRSLPSDSLIPDSLIPDSLIPDPKTNSEAKASGGEPPKVTNPDEIIFGYGVPLLTNAGSTDKHARSFLGGLRKQHGDAALIDKLRDCIKAKPLQPVEWLAAALPPKARASPGRIPAAENFASKDYGTGGLI